MRAMLALLLTVFVVCPAGEMSARAADGPKRPNVVLILADDLGRNDCSFMGGPVATPNLDKLCERGAKLDAFYVQPVCSPTRAALMTGRYPMRHGLQVGVVRPWAQYGLPLEERTLAEALRDAGYATAIVGKWHLGHFQQDYLPTQRGFDFQYGHYNGALDYNTHDRDGGHDWHKNDKANYDEGYSTSLLGREAAKFVSDQAGKKPFFLYVPFNAVHSPFQAPKKYTRPYSQLKGDRKTYAGMLAAMDESVGEIVDAVEKAGEMENTLFIFSSDNGGPAPGRVSDNGKYRGGKHTLYEGGVRVVAFAAMPKFIQPGTTIDQPMHIVDLYPTLIQLCGGKLEQKLPIDGRDVWPTLTEGKPSPHSSILLNTSPRTGAVRVGDWKLVVNRGKEDPDNANLPPDGPETVELFNLAADPYEKTNLATERPEKLAELKKELEKFASEAVPPKSRPMAKDFQVPKIWGESN